MTLPPVRSLTLRGAGLTSIATQSQQHQQVLSNSSSSSTITQTVDDSNPELSLIPPVLRLRGTATNSMSGKNRTGRHIKWHESVINNEEMGKKKSKVCCIYHAPREFGESSDESSSSDDDSSDDNNQPNNDDKDRPLGLIHGSRPMRASHHGHQHFCNRWANREERIKNRDRSPNAYEKLPRPRNRDGKT